MAKNKRESVWWQNNRSSLCFLLGFAEKPSWVLRFETLNNQNFDGLGYYLETEKWEIA